MANEAAISSDARHGQTFPTAGLCFACHSRGIYDRKTAVFSINQAWCYFENQWDSRLAAISTLSTARINFRPQCEHPAPIFLST
jgi:hypothetical protein